MNESTQPRRASHLLRGLLVASISMCFAEVVVSLFTMTGDQIWNRCDFPDDCIADYYPKVYFTLKMLWIVGAATAVATVLAVFLCHTYVWTRVRTFVAATLMIAWFLLTPVLWYQVGFTTNQQPAAIDARYQIGLLALLVAAALLMWDLVHHSVAPRRTDSSYEAATPE